VHRLALSLVAALCAFLLVGCGGDEAAPGPTLPRGLAADLAAQSDAIADTLAAGNVCGAAEQADVLLDDVVAAIEAGRVHAAFQESLTATANELRDQINCPQPDQPPPAPPSEEECAALEQQKADLEAERENTNGKGKQRKLDEQIAALEAQLQECPQSGSGTGESDEGDD
jgi:hypothetical protein